MEQKERERERLDPILDEKQIVSTKKPLSKKFADTFLSEDIGSVKEWLVFDVVIPGLKNAFLDTVHMLVEGEARPKSSSKSSRYYYDDDDEYTDYRSRYSGSKSRKKSKYERQDRDKVYYSDDDVDFRNIVVRRRKAAEKIVRMMRGRIRDFGSVSVAELLDSINAVGKWSDNDWGWTDERDIGIREVRDGFLIDVADPEYLND